jgi:immunity protein 8 of polymorphic toxin system
MVIPELKSLMSPNLERGQLPPDPEDCRVSFQAEIGPRGQEGTEIFSFVAITPRALARDLGARWGRGYLIVGCFSWDTVDRELKKLIHRLAGSSWTEVAEELAKELYWEFDNYKE